MVAFFPRLALFAAAAPFICNVYGSSIDVTADGPFIKFINGDPASLISHHPKTTTLRTVIVPLSSITPIAHFDGQMHNPTQPTPTSITSTENLIERATSLPPDPWEGEMEMNHDLVGVARPAADGHHLHAPPARREEQVPICVAFWLAERDHYNEKCGGRSLPGVDCFFKISPWRGDFCNKKNECHKKCEEVRKGGKKTKRDGKEEVVANHNLVSTARRNVGDHDYHVHASPTGRDVGDHDFHLHAPPTRREESKLPVPLPGPIAATDKDKVPVCHAVWVAEEKGWDDQCENFLQKVVHPFQCWTRAPRRHDYCNGKNECFKKCRKVMFNHD